MITMVESEVAKWKKRYEKCETIFMNLSKQPAWNYIDEIVRILSAIKLSIEQDTTISFVHIKDLTAWIDSAKASVEFLLKELYRLFHPCGHGSRLKPGK